jgi:hypothetical protein
MRRFNYRRAWREINVGDVVNLRRLKNYGRDGVAVLIKKELPMDLTFRLTAENRRLTLGWVSMSEFMNYPFYPLAKDSEMH